MKSYLTEVVLYVMLASLIFLGGCSPGNLEYNKQHAAETWKNAGFEIQGYEGYQWSTGGFGTSYGGADVWYIVRKTQDNGVTYHGYLYRWGDEIQIYNLHAIDAVGPKH